MLLGGLPPGGGLHHPTGSCKSSRGGPRTLGLRPGSQVSLGSGHPPLQLAGLRRQRRRRSLQSAASGREPGWDEWDAEGDLVAEATSATPDAATWGPLHAELRARWQRQQPHQPALQAQQQTQQQQHAAAASSARVGWQGPSRQRQATSSSSAPGSTQQTSAGWLPGDVPASAGNSVYSLSAAGAVPPLNRGPAQQRVVSHAVRPLAPPPSGQEVRYFTLGAVAAVALHYLVNFAATLPVVRSLVQRFVWWHEPKDPSPPPPLPDGTSGGTGGGTTALAMQYSEDMESVEWVNMCWRKAWRVYQRGIERWLADLLQPLFDSLVEQKMVPSFVQRLRIMEFTLDHEAPYFTNMRRRTSRKDSDLNGVVDVRYTGGARMLLLIEVGTGRWRIKIPVMVSDLDLESKLWLKIRLAPMCPWIGTLGLGFVGPPSIKVQLNPYNRIRLMKIPILQAFLTKFFTKDLPALITLPKRLEINIPPAVTAVAEAAVGRDTVMRAVASAVLQADALEHALLAALPLGPQGAAGGVSLPDLFQGELQVTLHEARELPVWGFPWQSNPYCRITLGSQAVQSRRDDDTSHAGRHRAPVWNQDFQFLVEDPSSQTLDIWIYDSPMTGRTEVGRASFPLRQLAADGTADVWLPVDSSMPGERTQGAVRLVLSYKPFQEDEVDSGYRAAADLAGMAQQSSAEITDVKSAADASSRAAVAASAAAAAVAVTKAAAARAAARIARSGQQQAKQQQQQGGSGAGSSGTSNITGQAQAQLPAISEVSSNGNQAPAPAASSSTPSRSNGSQPQQQQVSPGPAAAAAAAAAAVAAAAAEGATLTSRAAPTSSNVDGTKGSRSSSSSSRGTTTVEQLTTMAETMQKLTAEVEEIVHSGAAGSTSSSSAGGTAIIDVEVKAAAVEAVAAAEAAAITAVAAGDWAGANLVLQDAADALQSTVATLAAAEGASSTSSTASAASSDAPEHGAASGSGSGGSQKAAGALARAEQALAAAHAAASQAAEASAIAQSATAAVGSHSRSMQQQASPTGSLASISGEASSELSAGEESDGEAAVVEAVGLDAAPAAEAAQQRALGLPSYDSAADGGQLSPPEQPAWWLAATQFVPGVPPQGDQAAAEGTAAEADGGAGLAPRSPVVGSRGSSSSSSPLQPPAALSITKQDDVGTISSTASSTAGSGTEPGPVTDVVIPPDLPLEEITAEVLKSWKLRDTHVETLVQKAMEARRRQKERPWLQLLALASCAATVLLAAVLYRLEHMP